MNSEEAKKVLSLYRERIDDDNPQFTEALVEARQDQALSEWLRQEGESYQAIRNKLREIHVPENLANEVIGKCPTQLPQHRRVSRLLQLAAAIAILAGAAAFWFRSHDQPSFVKARQHRTGAETAEESGENAPELTVKGEVLDMACYIAFNLSGPEHAECAKTCIKKGLPVGIKGQNGKVYLLVGTDKAMNSELAESAAKAITVKGKLRVRDGFAMLDDVTITNL